MAMYILAAVCVALFSPVQVQAAAEVTAPAGRLVGLEQDVFGTTVHAFLGIPFAQPPVGDRRFRRAERLPRWDGIYNASTYPDMCIQESNLIPIGGQITPTSEDCLYLNVWQPNPVPTGAAVMVWIHGGGFTTGSSSQVDGKYLASTEGVIVVSVNYRLNVLGFLYTGTDDAPGNMGLTDQLLALQWVQDNIPAFGGDPSKVTIFGQSAGAASVGYHLLSPESRNLFSRAILQSGAALLPDTLDSAPAAHGKASTFAETLSCPTDQGAAAMARCLKSQDVQQFVTSTSFFPVADNAFIPADPSDALENGMFKQTDILIGATTNEAAFFFRVLGIPGFTVGSTGNPDKDQFKQVLKMTFPEALNEMALEAIDFQYTDWLHPDQDTRYRHALDAATGDYSFICPAVTTARAHARFGTTAYMYEFAYRVTAAPYPDWVRAAHGDELQFVFGLPTIPFVGYSAEDAALSRGVMRYWATFAKTGNPNNNDQTAWRPFTETDRAYLLLDGDATRMTNDWKTNECAFWDIYMPSLLAKTDLEPPEPDQCQAATDVAFPAVWGQSLMLALLMNVIKDIVSFIMSFFVL